MRSRTQSNGICASSALQFSQDSIRRSAWRRVPARIRTTFCCSGAGSKKSLWLQVIFIKSQESQRASRFIKELHYITDAWRLVHHQDHAPRTSIKAGLAFLETYYF